MSGVTPLPGSASLPPVQPQPPPAKVTDSSVSPAALAYEESRRQAQVARELEVLLVDERERAREEWWGCIKLFATGLLVGGGGAVFFHLLLGRRR